MTLARYPALFQINTRVWLTELRRTLGRAGTLDDMPDTALDRLAEKRFDWVWFLSVWQTGLAGQQVSRSNLEWRKEFQDTLPDLQEDDIAGSGFASPVTQCIAFWEAMQPWPGCASGYARVACG